MRATIEVVVDVEVRRPRQALWEFVTDPTTSPRWLDEFVESRQVSDGPPGVGTEISYTITPGPRTGTITVTEWDPPQRMAWDGPPLPMMRGGARPRGSFELSEHGGSTTRLVCTFRPELLGPPALLKPYLRRWLQRQRVADLQKLKAILEDDER